MPLSEAETAALLRLAGAAIHRGLDRGPPLDPELRDLPPRLLEPGASFVTLTVNNKQTDGKASLRGCIGSSETKRALYRDVTENAFAAAFRDPRFPPVQPQELEVLSLSVSVLTPPEPLAFTDEADLLARLAPGRDGLIIESAGYRALFLPQVWETLDAPDAFLRHLKAKAGLPADHPSDDLRVWRFHADSTPARRLHAVSAET